MGTGESSWLQIIVLALLSVSQGSCKSLNEFITQYEPVEYDRHSLMWHHNRVRRSLMGQQRIELEFFAHGRAFELVLEPDRDLFHPNFTLLHDETVVDQHHTKSFMYTGTVSGDMFSRVRGNLAHGVFDGVVRTLGEVYYIEPASRYSQHLEKGTNFHSIIYKQSDLNTTSLRGASCGSRDTGIHESMLNHQDSLTGKDHQHNDHVIRKRQTTARDLNKVRCWLSVRIDYKAFTNYMSIGQDPVATVLNVVSMGSDIFRDTDFNNDNMPDNIQFGIQEMIVERNPPPAGDFFANDFLGVEAFLNRHSTADYSDFCLAYRFTHRDFDGGVVGLAYVAAQPPSTNAGGICENARTFSGQQQTLNTGIVTSLNYGRNIAPSITALTFAHECGHNFGSNHDEGDPPADGAYIMYAFATSGNQPNNDEFSPASRSMMNGVIAVRGQGTDGCFVEGGNLCGNNLVDEGEDCDCGPESNLNADGICMENTCCFGRNCTLAPNVLCSPDQGPCCNSSCQFVPESANVTCSMETDCGFSQICGGLDYSCPLPDAKSPPVNTTFILCDNDEGVCDGATCNGTICLALNLTDCECFNMSQACHVCCMLEDQCVSTMDIATNNLGNLRSKLPGMMGRFVQVGRPCANFTGYCDFLNNCTAVDEEGALFRLANLFFNSEVFRRTIDFITRMWWVVVLAVLGLFAVMFLVVVLFHCLLPRAEVVKSHRRPSMKRRKVRPNQRQPHHTQPGGYPAGDAAYNAQYSQFGANQGQQYGGANQGQQYGGYNQKY